MYLPLPKKIKHRIRTILWDAKATLLKIEFIPGDAIILVYHGIVQKDHLKYNLRFTTIDWFRQQLTSMQRKFNIVTVEDIFEGRLDPHAFNVAITFDDGYLNNYTYAAPILDQLKIPAAFYITTIQKAGFDFLWADMLDILTPVAGRTIRIDGIDFYKRNNEFISNGKTLKQICKLSGWDFKLKMYDAFEKYKQVMMKRENLDYWQLMGVNEIASLNSNQLFTIGSHGLYHNNLESIRFADAASELKGSKQFLESIIQKVVTQFAYPDGSYNEDLIKVTEQCGYSYQLLASPKYPWSDKRTKERLVVNPFLHAKGLMKYIQKGSYL